MARPRGCGALGLRLRDGFLGRRTSGYQARQSLGFDRSQSVRFTGLRSARHWCVGLILINVRKSVNKLSGATSEEKSATQSGLAGDHSSMESAAKAHAAV